MVVGIAYENLHAQLISIDFSYVYDSNVYMISHQKHLKTNIILNKIPKLIVIIDKIHIYS